MFLHFFFFEREFLASYLIILFTFLILFGKNRGMKKWKKGPIERHLSLRLPALRTTRKRSVYIYIYVFVYVSFEETEMQTKHAFLRMVRPLNWAFDSEPGIWKMCFFTFFENKNKNLQKTTFLLSPRAGMQWFRCFCLRVFWGNGNANRNIYVNEACIFTGGAEGWEPQTRGKRKRRYKHWPCLFCIRNHWFFTLKKLAGATVFCYFLKSKIKRKTW